MADLYTPAEATALYNKCKITYDPRAYSLRDGLKLNMKMPDLTRHHIQNNSFGAEEYLSSLIQEFHKQDTSKVWIANVMDPLLMGNYAPKTYGLLPADVALCKKDNMYIALDYLETFVPKADLKSKRILEAIVQTCVALSSPKSCSADLHWLLTEFDGNAYEDLHNFKPLKTALEMKMERLPVYLGRTAALTNFVPAICANSLGPISPTGLVTASASEYEEIGVLSGMYYTLLCYMEVLWAMKSLPEPKLREIVKKFMYDDAVAPSTASDIEVLFVGDVTHNPIPEIEELISIDNPKERFNAYRLYANSNHFQQVAKDLATAFLAGSPKATIHGGFGLFIGFVQTYSNTWVRINNCKILYDYAMTNGLLSKLDPEDESAMKDIMSGLFEKSDTDTTSVHTATERTASDLMDLSTHAEHTGKATSDIETFISPTYAALDNVKSKYTDGRYEFDTSDKVDFGDSARAKYEAIANKVKLVNRVLTQKLREIKTYNTGGKQSGQASGRLDRKALYRYKYDSNIFYNNTYKQLESDLAFGVVLDISGSMHGRGIENGRVTMIVLHETLKALGINHSIIGHTSNGHYKCTIERYQAFREDKTYHTRKNYALAGLEAQNGNCDSASLFYMEKALMRTKNRDKICVIFSDGQPTECSGTDLREQVAHMERNGIKVIGIGINFPEIADYYKDYANGKNLTDMLNIVTNILKEYILKKKERA